MEREELNRLLGMSEEEMDAAGAEYERNEWGEAKLGKAYVGRPPLFRVVMGAISLKENKPRIAQMDARVASLGMSRSDYLRKLVDRDLATA